MQKLLEAAEKNRKLILDTERYVWSNPETGFREVKTSRYLENVFRQFGYDPVLAEDIPGFYTVIDTGREGPTLLILGEMDSVICPQHPEADLETGAVHACGHNVQCAGLVGIAAALKEPDVLRGLSGRIKLCAVPAEELLEISYRTKLQREGTIRYFTGKSEFLYRGYFDDVDLAFMVHASTDFAVGAGAVGCLAKKVTYIGKAAHAGGNPWDGINALYAANCGLNAINAIRETFEEKDIARVHPIITNGGAMVNAIPEEVALESFVRGASYEGILKNNKKINRALCGGALSLGANVNIADLPGYAPLINDKNLIAVAKDAAAFGIPDREFMVFDSITSGSTDMGDLSCVMPVVHPYIPGVTGVTHGADYCVADPEMACVGGTKFQLAMIYLLLSDNAKRARTIVENAKPQFKSKDDYFAFLDSLYFSGERICYTGDNEARVEIQ